MIRYIVSRLVLSVAMVLLATLVIFLIANTVPGDPVLTALGDMAASDPKQVAEFRARWGLDLPLWQQYLRYLGNLLQGDLGRSYIQKTEVTTLAHTQTLRDFAVSHGMSALSMWAIQRDNGNCPGNGGANDCSGIVQSQWAFSAILKTFTGP